MSGTVIIRGKDTLRLVDGDGSVRIENGSVLKLISGGPMGQRGPSGAEAARATGEITVQNSVWLMQHDQDLLESELNPALFWFEDENGNAMEPGEILWSTNDRALAVWDEPVRGTWIFN
jgi:hypothetical protein